MARTPTHGKVLTKAPGAKEAKMAKAPRADLGFAATWNATDKDERRQIRRLVRVGRPQQSEAHAELAAGFAAYQRTRPWYRFFWLWLVPVTVAGLIAGAAIHPVVIGMVLAAAGNAVLVRRNFRRVEDAVAAGVEPAATAA
jgi:hypothetical protein